jgi:SSS family solute:Na+ symporter
MQRLEGVHLDPTGGMSVQNLIVWLLIASWTFIDPGYHQRCAAARSEKVARKGILWSIVFWFFFDMLSLTTGLYAVAYLSGIKPLLAYPLLADQVMPVYLRGVFIVSLLAIVMSTVDSYAFLSALTFGRDIVGVLKNKPERSKRYTRIGLILTALISVLLIMSMPSVIQLWYNLGSLFIPPLLIPVLLAYFPKYRLPGKIEVVIMLLSFVLTFFLFLWGQVTKADGQAQYFLGIEPFFPGFILSLILHAGLYRYLRRVGG